MDPKARIRQFLDWAEWVAEKTPTPIDDQILNFLDQDVILDLIVYLYERFSTKIAHVDEMKDAALEYFQNRAA